MRAANGTPDHCPPCAGRPPTPTRRVCAFAPAHMGRAQRRGGKGSVIRVLAVAAGATAFVPKDAPSDELLRALRASIAGIRASAHLGVQREDVRRLVELLLGIRALSFEQLEIAFVKRDRGESLGNTIVRL